MEIFKKIIFGLLVAVFALGCIGDMAWLILYASGQRNLKTVVTTNIGEIENKKGEKKPVFKVKYYSNKNANGVEMLEILFTGYTGVDKSEFYSYGVQFVSPAFWTDSYLDTSNIYNKRMIYYEDHSYFTNYYDYSNGYSFVSSKKLTDDSSFIVETSDKDTFLLTFNGYVKEFEQEINFLWMKWAGPSRWQKYDHIRFASDFYNKAKSFNGGYGVFDATNIFDISDYFNIMKKNNDGQFKPIEIDEDLQEIKTFCTVDLEIVKDGAIVSADSMFGLINGKVDFDCSAPLSTSDYFSDNQFYTLTEQHFDYLLQYNGTYKAVIKDSVVNMLEQLNISIVKVEFSSSFLEKNNINLCIDYGCYYDSAPETVDIGNLELIHFYSPVTAVPLSEVA